MSAHQAEDAMTRIRNVELIELGRHRIQPWYFSPYPQVRFLTVGFPRVCQGLPLNCFTHGGSKWQAIPQGVAISMMPRGIFH